MQIDLSTKEIMKLLKLIDENSRPAKKAGENQWIVNMEANDLKMIRKKIKQQYDHALALSGWKDPEESLPLPYSGHLLIEKDDYTMVSGNMADDNYFAPDIAQSGIDDLIPVDEILRWKYYPEEGED